MCLRTLCIKLTETTTFKQTKTAIYLSAILAIVPTLILLLYYKSLDLGAIRSYYRYRHPATGNIVTTGLKSQLTPLEEISPYITLAVLANEDTAFARHPGIDLLQIWQALCDFILKGKQLRGASTISQQLVKNLYLSRERSFLRKLRELIYTLKIEHLLSKAEILTLYLNNIEFGENIIGISNASKFYFNKQPSEVTINEAVLLVYLIPNPIRRSRFFKTNKFGKKERHILLNTFNKTIAALTRFRKISDRLPNFDSYDILSFYRMNINLSNHPQDLLNTQEHTNFKVFLNILSKIPQNNH
ncbi:MAG: hypothetical protein D6719_05875 [Candidatus Dadabacteria bacterium]|nr:MAG: hypothetical protein D6719_05875 [Candidatus Dadabacteria bacterium]